MPWSCTGQTTLEDIGSKWSYTHQELRGRSVHQFRSGFGSSPWPKLEASPRSSQQPMDWPATQGQQQHATSWPVEKIHHWSFGCDANGPRWLRIDDDDDWIDASRTMMMMLGLSLGSSVSNLKFVICIVCYFVDTMCWCLSVCRGHVSKAGCWQTQRDGYGSGVKD